jgi:LPS sulfotransferase NodH
MSGSKIPLWEVNPELFPDDSDHKKAIEQLFPIDPNWTHEGLEGLLSLKRVVFVCFSNRSGSNLLLDTFARLGFGCEAGDELLNGETVLDHTNQYGFKSFEEYLEFVIRLRSPKSFVFMKIGPHQLFWLANTGLLRKYFSRSSYVLIEREDKIAQAVSMHIAFERQLFMQKATDENLPRTPVEYSALGILRRLHYIFDASNLFRYFFTIHSLPFSTVTYEQLTRDPVAVARTMTSMHQMQEELPDRWDILLRTLPQGIVRQADKTNVEYAKRFRNEFALPYGSFVSPEVSV